MALLRIIFVLCILSALILCVAWQETRVRQESRRLQEMIAIQDTRTAEVEVLGAQVARLQSPQRIIQIVENMNVGLGRPRPRLNLLHRNMALMDRLESFERMGKLHSGDNEDAAR